MHPLVPLVAELFFYIALPLVTGYAWVFGYHWYQYGTKQRYGTIALTLFLSGALMLLGVMFWSLQYVN